MEGELGPSAALHPFLPGAPWRTMREFMYEAFADMHRVCVQDVLLRPNALFDASLLTSPTQLSKALPTHARVSVDVAAWPGVSVMECRNTVLLVPAYSVDELGVGVGVELCGGDGPPDPYIPRPERVMHYVVNNRTGALITLADCGLVYEFGYQRLTAGGLNVTACLVFQRDRFRAAFSPGVVRFDALERALLRASHCAHDMPPAGAVLTDDAYPYRVTSLRGAFRMRSVISAYRDAVQLDAMRVSADWDGMRAIDGADLRHMKQWALTALFSEVAPAPQRTITEGASESDDNTLPECNPLALMVYVDRETTCRVRQQQSDTHAATPPEIPAIGDQISTSLLDDAELFELISESVENEASPSEPILESLENEAPPSAPAVPNPAPRATPVGRTGRASTAPHPASLRPCRALPVDAPPHAAPPRPTAVPIAPAPAPGVMPATGPAHGTALHAQQQKRLQRQIRKREAAARSHVKRKAARAARKP